MSESTSAASDVFEKARSHDRLEQLEAAKEHDLLPYFRLLTSAAGPVVEMEGRETIMLGSNNYLGLTGDERVKQGARDALEAFGTGVTGSRLLNGTTPLHLELERELAEWMGEEDAIVYTTGYQANVGCIGAILEPGDTVICDSGDHASILDGCRLSGAKLRPFRHNRMDKLEKMLGRAAEDGGGVLVVVDGVFSMEGDVCDLPRTVELCRAHGARLLVDEAHGAGVLGAARGRRLRAVRPRGRGRPPDGHLLEEPRLLRRLHRRPRRRGRVPEDLVALVRLQRLRRPGRGRRGAGGAAGDPQRWPGPVREAARQRRVPARGAPGLGLQVVEPGSLADGSVVTTPVVPVVVGDDWQAVLLWKALFEKGVYTNVAIHPAVPPGGALLRTSLMATHETEHLDAALETIAGVVAEFPDLPRT